MSTETRTHLLRLLLEVGQLLAGILQRVEAGCRREQRHRGVRVPLRDVPHVPVATARPCWLLACACRGKVLLAADENSRRHITALAITHVDILRAHDAPE